MAEVKVTSDDVYAKLEEYGLDKKSVEAMKNSKPLTNAHTTILNEAYGMDKEADKKIKEKKLINLISQLAIHFKAPKEKETQHKALILEYVLNEKIDKGTLSHALAFSKKSGPRVDLERGALEAAAGVGIEVTPESISRTIAECISKEAEAIKAAGWTYPLAKLLGTIKTNTLVKFGDAKFAKEEFDQQCEKLLGPKPDKIEAPRKPKEKLAADSNSNNSTAPKSKFEEARDKFSQNLNFPHPTENTTNMPDILKKHLDETGGCVITRFPPEPNGYLHIGHAKSMNLNFSVPHKFSEGGYTYLRFDDTNPSAEKQEYIDSIIEDVKWLGHKPKFITYSSDYFEKIYDCAIDLIKKGLAYVDEQPKEKIKEGREKKIESPYRNRSVDENMLAFDAMRKGKFEEGKAVLRVKGDMNSPNPNMRDFIAYRIKYEAHPHVGNKWCIYPTYDFTHCLVDSFENITHSLCTLEFDNRRESYMWELDACEVYKPVVWEFCRLNLTNTMLSKRKLIKLVEKGYVRGWDDPRMSTIRGFRRRGFTPTAINTFCSTIGVTRHNDTLYEIDWLEETQREELAEQANRVLCVTDPLKVTITNFSAQEIKTIEAPNHPKYSAMGSRPVPFTSVFYIERDDWRAADTKGYKRLAPGKSVGLLHLGAVITCTDVVGDPEKPDELKCTIDFTPKKGLGYIHWVACPSPGVEPLKCEVRMYDRLFKSRAPAGLEDWEADINPNSLIVMKDCFIEPSAANLEPYTRVQFERVGFFVVDEDTKKDSLVWNRILPLKASNWEEKKN